jgi:N-carbamoylputrescine amidase
MEAKHTFIAGLVQMACSADPADNLRRAVEGIEEAAAAGASVVCLPELFRSRYFCQQEDPAAFDLAETVPGGSTNTLAKVAREQGVWILAPLFEKRAAGLYHNTVAVISAGGELVGRYRKMHVPDDPGYHEKYYFTPGDLGFQTFHSPWGRIGTLICWDQWYPEAARLTVLQGALLLLYPTAIGWLPGEKDGDGPSHREAWLIVQRSHAITNGVYVAAINRTGTEQGAGQAAGIEFWGSSFVCDPLGRVIAEAPTDRELVLLAEIDPDRVESVRREWPFLRDRRIDAYDGLSAQYLDES